MGVRGFIGMREYKKEYIVKIGVYFIAMMYWEGGSMKVFWRYLSMSSEIRCIP
jgi:hypothetical protein